MNKEQIENIDKILKEVNATGIINKNDVYKMFKYREDAISTLQLLHKDKFVNIIEIEEDDGIHAIMSTKSTFDGIGYYLRFLEDKNTDTDTPNANPKRKKTRWDMWGVVVSIIAIIVAIILALF